MLQKNFSNSRLFSDHGSLVIRHCRRYRAVVPVLRRILTSALFAFAMLGVATSGAQAKKTLGIGAPGLAAKAAGGPVILTQSEVRLEAVDDLLFAPEIFISDGDTFEGPDWRIRAS